MLSIIPPPSDHHLYLMPYKSNESKRHHISPQRYKLSNWSDYNQALKNRGSIDLWIADDIESWWTHEDRLFDGTGSTKHYTDQAILTCHEIRSVFKLPLRQTEGFINSLFDHFGLSLKCPDYSLLCKRLNELNIKTPRYKNSLPQEGTVAIAFDSTGLKRYGRDEWYQEKHKVLSKRSWRKMHLGVGDNHIIHAAHLTDKDAMDDGVMEELCDQIDVNVSQTSADMMYDENHVYETIEAHFPEADIAIPPKDKLIYDERHHPKRRSNMLEKTAKGTISWQKNHDYGKRNHSEMAMQRYKKIIGPKMHARKMENQTQEMMIACGVLNRFTGLGMPQSYRTA